MPTFKCFSRNQLQDFLLGNVSDEDNLMIATHIEDCDVCEETIVGLDGAQDTLVELLGIPQEEDESPSDSEDSSLFQQAVEKIKQLDFDTEAEDINLDSETRSRIGDYEIEEQIAAGGMGSVFRARHLRLEKAVALKILPDRKMRNRDAIARFKREMKIIGQMDHPAMVNATDAGESDGMHYLVMELVNGLDLSKIVRLTGPLSIANAAALIKSAAIGLQYTHDRDVIHRDIKPSNIMLNRDGAVKILDLGLATLGGLNGTVDELTTVGQLMGTLDYMAPEQCGNDHKVDSRTDIYGLGATLYKLLTGAAPYSNAVLDTPLKKLKTMALEEPTHVSDRRQDLPDGLIEIVDLCLKRDPDERFQTAREVAQRLEPFVESSDVNELLNRAQELAEQESKLVTRHKDIFGSHSLMDSQLGKQTAQIEQQPKAKKAVTNSASRGGGFWRLATALALGGFAIWAGIVIYLQTTSGMLVIESEIEDVSVTLLEDEQDLKEIELEHGPNSTQLRAGKYKVVINGQSDGIVVDNGTFELKRGETVVTRITKRKSDSTGSDRKVATESKIDADRTLSKSTGTDNQLKFKGATIEDWIESYMQPGSSGDGIASLGDGIARLAPRIPNGEALIRKYINAGQTELSPSYQYRLCMALEPLCDNEAKLRLVFDNIVNFSLQNFTKEQFHSLPPSSYQQKGKEPHASKMLQPLLVSERTKNRELVSRWIVEGFNKGGGNFAFVSALIGVGKGQEVVLGEKSKELLSKMLTSDSMSEKQAACWIAAIHAPKLPELEKAISDVLSGPNDFTTKSTKSRLLVRYRGCRPDSPALAQYFVSQMAIGEYDAEYATRLMLTNKAAIELSMEALNDPKWGIPKWSKAEGERASSKYFLSSRSMGRSGGLASSRSSGSRQKHARKEIVQALNDIVDQTESLSKAGFVELLEKQVESVDDILSLNQMQTMLASLKNLEKPRLYAGRSYRQWIARSRKSSDVVSKINALVGGHITADTAEDGTRIVKEVFKLLRSESLPVDDKKARYEFQRMLIGKFFIETNTRATRQQIGLVKSFLDCITELQGEDEKTALLILESAPWNQPILDENSLALLRRQVASSDPAIRKRVALLLMRMESMRQLKAFAPQIRDLVQETIKSEATSDEIVIAMFARLERKQLEWFKEFYKRLSNLSDPKLISNTLAIAVNHDIHAKGLITKLLSEQPDFLNKVFPRMDFHSHPMLAKPSLGDFERTVFQQIVQVLVVAGSETVRDRYFGELMHSNRNSETQQTIDEQTKARDYLKRRYEESTDQDLKLQLKSILNAISDRDRPQ